VESTLSILDFFNLGFSNVYLYSRSLNRSQISEWLLFNEHFFRNVMASLHYDEMMSSILYLPSTLGWILYCYLAETKVGVNQSLLLGINTVFKSKLCLSRNDQWLCYYTLILCLSRNDQWLCYYTLIQCLSRNDQWLCYEISRYLSYSGYILSCKLLWTIPMFLIRVIKVRDKGFHENCEDTKEVIMNRK
jgi:hypothetical protein